MTFDAIDISHWQTGLSLAKAAPGGAIFKATDGTNFVDATCNGFVSDAKRLGIPWGVYHFAQNNGNMTAEADFFVKHAAGYLGHGLLVLDWEHGNLGNVSGAKAFLDRVHAKTGIRPLIYMSQSVAAAHDWSSVERDYALWVARYSSSIGSTGGWPVTMWQYTSSGHVNGYSGSVDKDHFYGTHDTWTAFATGDDSHTTADDTTPDDKGDDDMPEWKNASYGEDWTLPADGEWRTIPIAKSDSGAKDYSFLWGPKRCTGTLNVTVASPTETEVDLRPVYVETKSGQDTKLVQSFPATEFFTHGGSSQLGIPFAQDVAKGDDGWSRRLRFQVRAWGGGKVTVTGARARALYWDK